MPLSLSDNTDPPTSLISLVPKFLALSNLRENPQTGLRGFCSEDWSRRLVPLHGFICAPRSLPALVLLDYGPRDLSYRIGGRRTRPDIYLGTLCKLCP